MRRRLPRLALLGALTVAAVLGLLPARAAAANDVRYGLTDDAWLSDGPGTLDDRLARLQSLGVEIVRFSIHWDQVAPSQPAAPTDPADPAYDWSSVDDVLNGLHADHFDVIV